MHRLSFFWGIFLSSTLALAQVTDSFDDGDFTSGTIWSGVHSEGNADHFEIAESDNQLKSQSLSGGSGTRVSYLSTPNSQDLSASAEEWNFRFRLGFSRPSGSSSTTNGNNTSRVYLMSSAADLSGDLNGYYLELRYPGTSDFNEVRLYRQDAGVTTELTLSGTVQTVTSASFASVKVNRSASGEWEVEVNSISQGTVTDNTYTATTHLGVQVRYSANSRSGLFYFDDFAPAIPPTITSSAANSSTEVLIDFSENIDQTSAETTANYSFNNGITVSSAERNATDNSQVTLTVSTLTSGTSYTVTVNNVEDESSNPIATDSETTFEYIEFATAGFRDVVINELMIDETPVVGLPEAEFIELYNPTDQFYALENWAISDDNSPGTSEKFGAFTLRPNSYVIICDDSDESLFTGFGDVIAVTSLGSLTNSGDDVVLSDASGTIIDNLTYSSAPADGITYEQVNPDLPCSGDFNFVASTNSDGGTPGEQNSVFDDAADATAPTVSSLTVVDTDSIQITFSEPLESSTVTTSAFGLSGFTISSVTFSSDAVVDILLSTDLVSESSYDLTYFGITDCSGNGLSDTSTTFYYDVTAPELDRLVVATDNSFFLIFNEPLNESDAETEANFSLDQSFGEPASAILQDSAGNRILIAFDSDFTAGINYTLSFNALEDTIGNALSATNKSFTFQDQIDSVYAISSNILQITYTTTPSSISASKTNNYLLEDVGNPTDVLEGGNDQTYRLVFDVAMDDNSDLLLYVENVLVSDASDTLVTPAYSFRYDTDSPSLASLNVNSATQLELIFDEALEINSATNLNNYELEDDETPVSATLNEDTVTLTFEDGFETEQEKTLTYTQIEDLYGNSFTSNRTEDFTYDPLAPRVDSIYQVDDKTIILRANEQLSLASIDVANFSTAAQNAASFALKGPDSLELELSFTNALTENQDLDFNIAVWQDLLGNSLTEAIDTSVNTLAPRVGSTRFKTDSTVQITFSKSMEAGAYDLTNYELTGLTVEAVTDVGDNTAEIVIEGSFSETTYVLSLSNVTDENNNDLQFTSLDLTFETYLSSITILDSLTVELQFETEFTDFPRTNIQVNSLNPDLVSIDPDDPKRVQLLLSEALEDNSEVTFYWNSINDRFERSLPDHTTTISYDLQSPSLSRVESQLENVVQVVFDEPINTQSAASVIQYTITDIGDAQTLAFSNDSTVQLTFSTLDSGTVYQLVTEDIADLTGNYTGTDTLSFTYAPPEIISLDQVVFSEILADPSPVVGLPEAEYIEVLNTSNRTLDLASMRLSNDTDTIRLGAYELASGAAVVLIDDGDEDLFSGINALAVDGFFSLDNAGELLVLSNINDELVDSLTYSSDWYGDEDKDNGGYSLELIEPLSDCSEENNWSASENALGGTPGSANSLETETDAPTVISSSLSDSTVSLSFNEEMNESSIITSAFSISGDLTIASLTSASESAELVFAGSLTEGQTFDLSLSGLSDCRGNAIVDTTLSFVITAVPQAGDLIINEIMADPSPVVGLPEVEYIEIFNASDSIIDLQGLILTKTNSTSTLETYFLDAQAYVAIVDENDLELMSEFNVIGVSDLISFSNDEDSIVLTNADSLIIDRVQYSNTWYGNTEKDNGGYSLELIEPLSDCSDENNWLASENTLGGTPGSANSLEVETESPTVISGTLTDRTISLIFNEEMNESTIATSAFTISGGLTIASLASSSESAELIFAGNLTEGQTFNLSLSGLSDCRGNAMVDTTLSFVIAAVPLAGDLIINEIMADPSPAVGLHEVEYIEIFNASDSIIDLQGLILTKVNGTSTLETYFLDARAYVAIVDESDLELMSEFNVVGVSDLIGFSNDEDSIVLKNTDDLIIDRVQYEDNWYGDPDRDDGGYSLELIDRESACSPPNNWGASTAEPGGTPGADNAIMAETELPTIVESIFSEGRVTLQFSEEMLTSTILDYAISQEDFVDESEYDEAQRQLQLVFNEAIASAQQIDLMVIGIADCSGNIMNDSSLVFLQAIDPIFNDIIITEIMSDPDPEVGLPNREYLEIYNRSDNILDLNEMVIQDESGISAPIGGVILPGEYQILVSTSGIGDFSNVIVNGVGSFPGLSNSGEQLSLLHKEALIFQVNYEAEWHDTDKEDGGFSLEVRDTNNPCGTANNWGSSIAESGGTPGLENSIQQDIPDNFGPNLLRAIAIEEDSILLTFDEALIPTLSPVISISGGIEVTEAIISLIDLTTVTLSLNQSLERGVVYTVTIVLAQDCLGNSVQANTAELVLPFEAEASQVLLSEIMFNPLDDGVDFVEVYNTTDQFISLKGWFLGNESLERVITEGDLILEPEGYLAFTENEARLQLDFPDAPMENLVQVEDLPTYSNDFGDVYLIDAAGNDQDSLFYDADYHSDLLRSVDGVSLERISFEAPNNADNWNSAASTVGFGTPGAANSQSLDLSAFNDPVEAEPRVFIPGSGTNSFTTINYAFETSGNFANINLFDQNGRFVKELARGISLAGDGFIRWDGTGADGGIVRVGYYVVVFEVFNSNGQSEVFKETVVVGRDF